jgi:CRISPR/Cas system CSM-associated protein Csm3 (group 7 of RAMP superfamily)
MEAVNSTLNFPIHFSIKASIFSKKLIYEANSIAMVARNVERGYLGGLNKVRQGIEKIKNKVLYGYYCYLDSIPTLAF